MNPDTIARKNLDNAEFVQLRRATDKLASFLNKRLSGHLEVLKSLFIARALLGSYVKSASMEDVPVSDKAFADLQERYAAVCEKPFGLPRKPDAPRSDRDRARRVAVPVFAGDPGGGEAGRRFLPDSLGPLLPWGVPPLAAAVDGGGNRNPASPTRCGKGSSTTSRWSSS